MCLCVTSEEQQRMYDWETEAVSQTYVIQIAHRKAFVCSWMPGCRLVEITHWGGGGWAGIVKETRMATRRND
jgi:hypothetical protein